MAWSEHTAGGNVYFKDSALRLVREQLHIGVGKRLKTYRVDARYFLQNPKRLTRVGFGVPIFLPTESIAAGVRKKALKAAQKSVDVRIGRKRFPCVVRDVKGGKALLHVPRGWRNYIKARISHVCVATLTLPTSKSFELRLQYKAQLLYVDSMTSKSSQIHFGNRYLYYPLFPAGYWAGKAKRVDVTVALGAYGCVARMVPAKGKRRGNVITWSWRDVDLRQAQPVLALEFRCFHQMQYDYLARANLHKAPVKRILSARAKIKASSVWKRGKKASFARYAIDGDPKTAWCPAPTAKQPWIELRVPTATSPCDYDYTSILLGPKKLMGMKPRPPIKGFWITSSRLYKDPAKRSRKKTRWLEKVKQKWMRFGGAYRLRNVGIGDIYFAGYRPKKGQKNAKLPKDFILRIILPKKLAGKDPSSRCIREIVIHEHCY